MNCLQVFLLLCASLPYSYQFGNALVAKYTICFIQGYTCYRTTSCGPEENKVRHGVCRYGEECCFQPPCTSDADCVLRPNSHCNEGICRCDIGYGLDGNTCRDLRECGSFSSRMTVYEGYFSAGYNLYYFTAGSAEVCQEECINLPECRSSELDSIDNDCYISGHDWFDVDVSDRVSGSSRYDYYQRECNW